MPKGEPTDTTDFVVCTEPIVANCWYKAWGKRGGLASLQWPLDDEPSLSLDSCFMYLDVFAWTGG